MKVGRWGIRGWQPERVKCEGLGRIFLEDLCNVEEEEQVVVHLGYRKFENRKNVTPLIRVINEI